MQRNGTLARRLKVHRGIAHAKDLGRLVELDGKKDIDIWINAECNRFHGTDGWIFPALTLPEEGLPSFSTDLCRYVPLNKIKLRVDIFFTYEKGRELGFFRNDTALLTNATGSLTFD